MNGAHDSFHKSTAHWPLIIIIITIIIMYIYHALIIALSAHLIHINLNIIFYTHVEHSPIYIESKLAALFQMRRFEDQYPTTMQHVIS